MSRDVPFWLGSLPLSILEGHRIWLPEGSYVHVPHGGAQNEYQYFAPYWVTRGSVGVSLFMSIMMYMSFAWSKHVLPNWCVNLYMYYHGIPLPSQDKHYVSNRRQLSLLAITSSIDFIDNIAKFMVKCQICRPLCIRFSLHPLRCNYVKSLNSTLCSAVRVQCAYTFCMKNMCVKPDTGRSTFTWMMGNLRIFEDSG